MTSERKVNFWSLVISLIFDYFPNDTMELTH